MKPNVLIALLVGLVLGFAVGRAVSGPSPQSPPTAARPSTAAPLPADESALTIKSSEMPEGTFEGMSDAQKYAVMKVMNDNTCDCGCDKGTLANCVKTDPGCPNSPAQLKKAVALAKEGKSAEQIQQELLGPKKAAAAPGAPGARAADATVYKVPLDNAPVLGPKDALVTIVEFSDYQCPFCSRAHNTVSELLKEYGPKVRLAMKQNPLPMHPQAEPASIAALAASEQGKYWQVHDLMFANQRSLDDASLEKYAKEAGVDIAKWKASLKDPKWKALIDKDQAQAHSLGASGTPAFFINGRKLSGAQPKDNFKKIIDEELGKAERMVSEGVSKDQLYAKIIEKGATAPAAPSPSAAPSPKSAVKKVPVPADSPMQGAKNAKVTIVEFSDFQCPFCARTLPGLKQIEQAYPKDVRVVFRHFPLTSIHPNAEPAAEASMAAHEQGKFWEFHDKLFENQTALTRANFEKFAQEIGLNVTKFKAALDSGKFKQRVAQDISSATQLGVGGTPTFFVNGREHVGALTLEATRSLIDEEIAKANKLLSQGTKPEALYEKLIEQGASTAAQPSAPPSKAVAVGNAPVKGPSGAPVTIVTFSDFQCPFCSRVVPTLKTIEDKYKGKVRVAFKNQPLPMHPQAKLAAAAALAANEQGKFWEYHDKLFANQRSLDRASLDKYAQELGLNMDKFKSALDSSKYDAQIAADMAEASSAGATGTPTFFINGRQLVGAQPPEAFQKIIDEELAKGPAAKAKGTKG